MKELPSAHQIKDFVTVSFADAGSIKNCRVEAVTFEEGKVFYDVSIKMTVDGKPCFTELTHIDSAFVTKY